ncbi:MAG: Gfo/Idh/MocA family oxidoreductase [Chitinophagaceae bacterium]|nr:MAG: Gfo/Idh/MocA family oxidoreductase [Chitinophagaceae bacterium]
MNNTSKTNSRRKFLKNSMKTVAGTLMFSSFPEIVPASVFGKLAPSNRINIGAIGIGRISTGHDLPGVLRYERSQVVAVCDLDSNRLQKGKEFVDGFYTKKNGSSYNGTKTFENFEDVVSSKDIDAVVISTPDHWHVIPALAAVRAGKDVYMQKPASLTISEGRLLSNEVHRHGRIFQIGSQQRSMPQFKRACELVRNGRIGKVHTVYVGLPIDDPKECTVETKMAVPANLNYDKWLGSTPEIWYTEKRVHPQNGSYDRPGWLRCEQFGAGMITGWGVHHFDIVNWGLGYEFTGPSEIIANAQYPDKKFLWNVHGPYKNEFTYADGVKVIASNDFPNGVKFEGSDGWIFVTRGNYAATASDPVSQTSSKALEASDPKILTSVIGADEIHLYESKDHHANWLDCVISREQPITPIEVGHRACSVCLINHTAMKLGRKLQWDPMKEQFIGDKEANKYLTRPQRAPYLIV